MRGRARGVTRFSSVPHTAPGLLEGLLLPHVSLCGTATALSRASRTPPATVSAQSAVRTVRTCGRSELLALYRTLAASRWHQACGLAAGLRLSVGQKRQGGRRGAGAGRAARTRGVHARRAPPGLRRRAVRLRGFDSPFTRAGGTGPQPAACAQAAIKRHEDS